MGFIKFGSRVDVFLPLTATVKIKIGQKVIGNIDVIAEVK
jgi:phosphatidylserine decarboxylase